MDGLRDQRTDLVLALGRHTDKTTPETLLASQREQRWEFEQ
jgi:hypothetical protein